jgi:hypothetical protein
MSAPNPCSLRESLLYRGGAKPRTELRQEVDFFLDMNKFRSEDSAATSA